MTDNEITREKTFSEELPYFKERIKEVFDNYDNLNDSEDPLYIAVLRDSKRVVRKAEEEITRQQAENENSKVENQSLRSAANSLKMHYEEAQAEIERLQKEVNLVSIQFQDLQERTDEIKAKAYKEFAEKLQAFCKVIITQEWNKKAAPISWSCAYADFIDDIDNLLKKMVGENESDN